MSVIRTNHIRVERFAGVCLAWMAITIASLAQGFSTTTVQGTVYLANGSAGSGTLQISWPAFTTAANQSVAAGRIAANIGADGFVSVNLTPNLGASPAGLFYTAVYHMKDGTTSTEYWVIPNAAQASIAQVRSTVMPAAQAAQAVSKAYVDQAIQSVAQGNLTSTGGQLTGPLYLTGDPTQSLQAADKHYVDTSFAQAMPLTGGAASGPLTANKLGGTFQVDQFPGSDFGAKLQACISAIDTTYGGTCDARNFTGMLSMAANLTIATANTVVLLPCATLSTANQVIVPAGTRNVSLRGCALRGSSAPSGTQGGTVLMYSGRAAAIQVGDQTYASDTLGFHLENVLINTTASSNSTTQAFAAYRTQELDLQSLYLLGNANQTGMTLDGTGNYTGGTFYDNHISGFQTAIVGVGHQVTNSAATDWLNAGTFVRLHIDCPTNNGNPINGTYGVNLLQGDGNSFTGGDVENCSTALHLGANAQNNTVLGLRNENSTYQVVADPGSSYNSWITGGTMFTGRLVDNGTRNSFLDTFHRAFNSLNGDWYGSQQDSTLTNHYRLGIGSGNERGLLDRYQTDYGYRWTMGLSDAGGGEQFYQVLDELNSVYRISVGQYNNGQASTNNQTVINAAGSGAVVLNGSNNSGTGGVVFGSGGPNETTVATVSNTGNAQFNGTVQVGGTTQSAGTMTVRNNADSEVDYYLWPGLTASQKGSFTYKDYNGNSQWYMVKDANNNWALNSAVGGLDSFKAYQSTNGGDTYINASNSGGVVRVNYESGAGSTFNIYGGSSGNLYAGFSGANSIKFPGLSAASGRNCLQIDSSGYISNTGAACGTGNGSGTVNGGSTGQIANYAANGTAVSGASGVTTDGAGSLAASVALSAPKVNNIVYANPNAPGTTTAGINEAIASFGAAPKCGTVMLPKGNYSISTTIGGSVVNNRKGCRFIGHGSGDTSGGNTTYLTWAGTPGGVMVDILNCVQCEFANYVLDGGGTAGVAEWVDTSSSQNEIHNITILNLASDGSGVAEQMGVSSGIVPGETHWHDMRIGTVGTCWYVFGLGTADGRIDGSNVCTASVYGVHVAQYSELNVQGVTFAAWGGAPITLFQEDAGANWLEVSKCYGEAFSNIFNVVGTLNANGPDLRISDSVFNPASSTNGISVGSYTGNGILALRSLQIHPAFTGAHIDFNPVGTRGNGYIGTMSLSDNTFGNLTISNTGVTGGNGDIVARATWGGPTGAMTWYPSGCQTCGSSEDFFDSPSHGIVFQGSTPTFYYDSLNNIWKQKTDVSGSNAELSWYLNGNLCGGWSPTGWVTAPSSSCSAFAAYNFVVHSSGGYKSTNGNVLIPGSATTWKGSSSGGALLCASSGAAAGKFCDSTGAWNTVGQTVTTGSIGGSALTAGQCASGTATLTTSATGHAGTAAPSDGTNIQTSGGGLYTPPQVTVNGTTATVQICAIIAGTPTSKTYTVTVF